MGARQTALAFALVDGPVDMVTKVQVMRDASCYLAWAADDVTLRVPDGVDTAGASVGLWDSVDLPGG